MGVFKIEEDFWDAQDSTASETIDFSGTSTDSIITLTFETGDLTSASIDVFGIGYDETQVPIEALNLSDNTLYDPIVLDSTQDYAFEVNAGGFDKIKLTITAIVGELSASYVIE